MEDSVRLSEPRIVVYDGPWWYLADLSNLVGKVYNLCRVKSYSNSRVLGHGRLEWSLSSPMSVLFSKDVFERKRREVPDGVLGGYCRGTMKVRSTCRVLPRKGDGHV
jgi:hypothetical protein